MEEYAFFGEKSHSFATVRMSTSDHAMSRPKKRHIKTSAQADASPAEPSSVLHRLDDWLADKHLLILAILATASLAIRIAYFTEVSRGPLIVLHRWDQSDMYYFDSWARDIVAGGWLSRNIMPPMHLWHFDLAKEYFQNHPEEYARLSEAAKGGIEAYFTKHPKPTVFLKEIDSAQIGPDVSPQSPAVTRLKELIVASALLWNEWMGKNRFYQEPLYPYLIALTYKIVGADARFVFVWQLALGIASNLLIYLIARRHFGQTAGVAAGLLAVLCSPLLYFELALLRETLIVFTGLLLVWLAGEAAQRNSTRWWLVTGAAMGLSLTLKSHFAVLLLGTLALLAWQHRNARGNLARYASALVVGVVVATAPLVARNLAVGAPALSFNSAGGINFILGNANEPGSNAHTFRTAQVGKIIEQTQGRLLPTMAATLHTYETYRDYMAVLGDKFAAIWHWYESQDNTDFYYCRLHSAILRCLPVTFLILAPLAIVGLFLGVERIGHMSLNPAKVPGNAALHLYLLVFTNVLLMMVFFVRDRYRAPLEAALIPFAALTLVAAAEWFSRPQTIWKAVGLAGCVFLLALWTARPLPLDQSMVHPQYYFAPYTVYYFPMADEAERTGNYLKAAEILADSFRYEPEIVKRLGPSCRASSPLEEQMGKFYAQVHRCCAEYFQLAGQRDAAQRELARSNELIASCP
jgi:4-amino-4-deoxy-L-arabinose transferase-like glycosyltransferase